MVKSAPRPLRGILLILLASVLLPLMDSTAKYLSQSYPLGQVVWARYFFQLLTMLPFVLWRDGPRALWPRRPSVQLLRGVLLLCATGLFFSALARLPLATAVALFFVSPLVVTVLSPLFLKEQVGWRRWLAVLVGFVGVWIVMRPGTSVFQAAGLLAIGAGTVHGLYLITTRRLSGSAPPLVALFYTAVVGALVMSVLVIGDWRTPTGTALALMVLMGGFASLGHLLVIRAFDFAPAPLLAPVGYFEIVSATVIGLALFGDFPDALTWVGVAVIAGSGIFVSIREGRAARGTPHELPG